MNPVLEALKELGGSAKPAEVCSYIAEKLQLSEEELSKQNKEGGSSFENQVAWVRFYLVKAGYIDSSKYGVWKLTEKGHAVNELSEDEINQIKRIVLAQIRGRKQEKSPIKQT
jgi:restriction system protein